MDVTSCQDMFRDVYIHTNINHIHSTILPCLPGADTLDRGPPGHCWLMEKTPTIPFSLQGESWGKDVKTLRHKLAPTTST